MRKIAIMIVVALFLAVPVMAQEKITPEQQIEKFNKNMLDLKSKYGAEVVLSARLQLQVLALQKQVKQLREALTATVKVDPEIE